MKSSRTITSLARVPAGQISDGELEREKGKRVWSFDINKPHTKDITEAAVFL